MVEDVAAVNNEINALLENVVNRASECVFNINRALVPSRLGFGPSARSISKMSVGEMCQPKCHDRLPRAAAERNSPCAIFQGFQPIPCFLRPPYRFHT